MGSNSSKAAFGATIGVSPQGVVAHSSYYASMSIADVARMSSYRAGEYCGVRWQCVEYARRWLLHVHGITFASVGMAYEIFDLPEFYRPAATKGDPPAPISLKRFADGTSEDPDASPGVGDIVLWAPKGHFTRTGHVAVVVATHADAQGRRFVDLGEQNVTDASWGGNPFSRRLALKTAAGGGVAIVDTFPGAEVIGWVRPLV